MAAFYGRGADLTAECTRLVPRVDNNSLAARGAQRPERVRNVDPSTIQPILFSTVSDTTFNFMPAPIGLTDAASGGNIVNQVQRHPGAVTVNSTPKVQYTYSEMSGGANHSRLTGIVYPAGMTLSYNYASGLDDAISHLSSLSDTSGTLESYSYPGLGTVVIRSHSQPGVDLTFVKQSGESNGDAGDQYTGLDRFGRVVDQRWRAAGLVPMDLDRFQYAYDRDGNRLWRDNLVNSAFGELYSYDNLNQITSFDRGTLNANKNGITGSPTRQQAWDFDALGNFDSVTTDGNAQTRSHNDQNEITSISGATTPTYDANGNMTGDETGRKFVYDAWNRLVTVKDSGNNVLESFAYDGVNRRVSTTASSTTTDLYYSAEWQVLEDRVGGNTTMQYVWSPVYVDAMILRDRDTDANGSLDERLWVQQDANFNVTAIVNGSGVVVERYAYDPFGSATIYDASWGSRSSSSYAWLHLHQSGRYDATSGLYYFRYRDYSAAIGRWMQVDPEHISAGDMNFYRALGDRPTDLVDPMGSARRALSPVGIRAGRAALCSTTQTALAA